MCDAITCGHWEQPFLYYMQPFDSELKLKWFIFKENFKEKRDTTLTMTLTVTDGTLVSNLNHLHLK